MNKGDLRLCTHNKLVLLFLLFLVVVVLGSGGGSGRREGVLASSALHVPRSSSLANKE
jgi:hypothetical protein